MQNLPLPSFFSNIKWRVPRWSLSLNLPERLNKVIFIGLEYLILIEIKHERGSRGEFRVKQFFGSF